MMTGISEIRLREIAVNEQAGNAIIEVAEKKMADELCKLDGEVLLGHTLRF